MTWRFLAFDALGGGFLRELPLTAPKVTRALSGPGRLTGTLAVEQPEVLADLRPWATTIWAEQDRVIRGGGILTPPSMAGSDLALDCVGISGYPKGQPWTGPDQALIDVDPLDVVRLVWGHLQGEPDGGLGVQLDATTSTARVGQAAYYTDDAGTLVDQGQALAEDGTVRQGYRRVDAAPLALNWWSTHDLGGEIDKLAGLAPFDYLEHTAWAADGESLTHRLRLGAPTLGGRRPDLRFAIGENVIEIPPLDAADEDYASDVLALGAGEERATVHTSLRQPGRGLRRVRVFIDKAATDTTALAASARSELGWATGAARLSSLVVLDHPHAPLGSFDVGDEVQLTGPTGWVNVDRWVRITEMTIDPTSDRVTLQVLEV